MPKASIIIPCYNLGVFLEEALASALAQTYPDYEVLLIDDGSTDAATIELLDRLPHDARLRVLRTPNQGVARARNQAIGVAQGQYILPLDADDRILPSYLERAIRLLEAAPDVGFVGCHYRVFGDREAEYRPEAYRIPDLLVENVVPIASVYRRSCWEAAGGYCPDLNSMEDWDLWLSILGQGYRGEIIPEILFEYRVRPNSNLSFLRDPDVYEARMTLLYKRHARLFDAYAREVLRAKDRQFANLHAYAMWQEQQARNWARVAQERQDAIAGLGPQAERAVRRRMWWREQVERVRRATADQPGVIRKSRSLAGGLLRVLRRQVRTRLGMLTARVRRGTR